MGDRPIIGDAAAVFGFKEKQEETKRGDASGAGSPGIDKADLGNDDLPRRRWGCRARERQPAGAYESSLMIGVVSSRGREEAKFTACRGRTD